MMHLVTIDYERTQSDTSTPTTSALEEAALIFRYR